MVFIYSRLWFENRNGAFYSKREEIDLLNKLRFFHDSSCIVGSLGESSIHPFLSDYDKQVDFTDSHLLVSVNRISKSILPITHLGVFCRSLGAFLRSSEVILFFPPFPSIIFLLISKLFRKNVLVYTGVDIVDNLKDISRVKRAFLLLSERILLLSAPVLITASTRLYSKAIHSLPCVEPPKPIISPTFYKSNFRLRSNISNGPIVIGMVGYVVPRKNLEFVIECVTYLRSSMGLEVVLKIFGHRPDEPYYRKLLEMIKPDPLGGGIHFVDGSNDPDEVHKFYNSVDVICIASHHEGFPRVIYEAITTGCVLILPDKSYITKSWLPEDAYYMYEFPSIKSFALQLIEMMSDNDVQLRKRIAAYKFISDFLLEDSIGQFERLLNRNSETR